MPRPNQDAASLTGCPVHVLSVDPLDAVAATRTADRAVQYLLSHGVEATAVPIARAVSVSRVILEHAALLRPGLIVMGAYGRTRFEEFFLGSTTQQLLKESPVPLFLYH